VFLCETANNNFVRIVSVQYVHINFGDPLQWLNRIDFYTGIFDELARNFEVHAFYHTQYVGALESNNVKYHFTGMSGWSLILPFKFHRQVAQLKPDVILVQGFHHPFQLWFLRKVLSGRVRFFLHHHAERPLRFHKRYFQQLVDQFVSGYFFVSRQQAGPWIAAGQISDEKNVYEVMECSSVYKRIHRPAYKKTGASGKVYLWVGRLESNKDPLTLVKAFAEFLEIEKDAFLYLVYQQEDLLQEVKSIIADHPQIVLVGRQNKDQLLEWYNKADFIVSTSHYEGSGIAVCEAMSCGCIPILTSIPSFRWMTNESIGLSFQAGEVDQLLRALKKSTTLNHETERKKTIENFQARLSFSAIASGMTQAFLK